MVSENKHPLDIEGLNYEHNEFFWFPYGLGEDVRSKLYTEAFCPEIVFFKTDIIDYKMLLKECITRSWFLSKPCVITAIAPGFKYLDISWNSWEDIEADNMFFCRLFWSVYLHMRNYEEKVRRHYYDEEKQYEMEGDWYCDVAIEFERVMRSKSLGIPRPRYINKIDYLPAYLEAYKIK